MARDLVARSFDLVIQLDKVRMDRRVITEISELEVAREALKQRIQPLYEYDYEHDRFIYRSDPSPKFLRKLEKYGVTLR